MTKLFSACSVTYPEWIRSEVPAITYEADLAAFGGVSLAAYPAGMSITEIMTERNAAFLALDEARIRAYCAIVGAKLPAEPVIFWAGIHKARMVITTMPESARATSREWLAEHGMSAGIAVGEVRGPARVAS